MKPKEARKYLFKDLIEMVEVRCSWSSEVVHDEEMMLWLYALANLH